MSIDLKISPFFSTRPHIFVPHCETKIALLFIKGAGQAVSGRKKRCGPNVVRMTRDEKVPLCWAVVENNLNVGISSARIWAAM